MWRFEPSPVDADNPSYTPGVTARRLISMAGVAALAWLVAPNDALAQTQNSQDAARAASQAARAAADAAEDYADGDIQANQELNPLDKARQGVVVLERAGKPIGVGTVLRGDGRILTALSPLGHGNSVDARFADGSVSRVRVGHSDRAWDLALLIPQNGRWQNGLKASRKPATAAGSDLRSFSLVGGKKVMLTRTIVKGERTMVGGDSELLRDALEMASRFKSTDIGSPVVDGEGNVVAVVAKACAPATDGSCVRVPYGVPVSAVKAFLRTVPANAVPPAPWLGIQGAAEDTGVVRGVRVLSVHASSPAAAAGLQGGNDKSRSDIVVAIDGRPITSPEQLATEINSRAVGDSVQLLVFGKGKFRQVSLTLRPTPGSQPRATAKPTPAAKAANTGSRRQAPARRSH
jgi:serine protease Do